MRRRRLDRNHHARAGARPFDLACDFRHARVAHQDEARRAPHDDRLADRRAREPWSGSRAGPSTRSGRACTGPSRATTRSAARTKDWPGNARMRWPRVPITSPLAARSSVKVRPNVARQLFERHRLRRDARAHQHRAPRVRRVKRERRRLALRGRVGRRGQHEQGGQRGDSNRRGEAGAHRQEGHHNCWTRESDIVRVCTSM